MLRHRLRIIALPEMEYLSRSRVQHAPASSADMTNAGLSWSCCPKKRSYRAIKLLRSTEGRNVEDKLSFLRRARHQYFVNIYAIVPMSTQEERQSTTILCR